MTAVLEALTVRSGADETGHMSREEIDHYLEGVDAPARATLEDLRQTILSILPDAEQCISYRIPAFRVDGRVIAGFAAFRSHLSYFPFSGSVLGRLPKDIAGYRGTKSALHFALDQPLPRELVRKLIDARLREVREA